MDAPLTRSDRFSYEPITRDGKPVEVEADITKLDVRRWKAMAPYDYLDALTIAALTGGDEKSVTHRFNRLKRKPDRWIDLAAPLIETKRSMKVYRTYPLAYSLNGKSTRHLKERGFEIHSHGCSGPFVHKMTTAWIRASFDIAEQVEKAAIEVIPFHKIKEHCGLKGDAQGIDVSYRYQGELKKKRIYPDCYPFAINTEAEGYALLLLETDCDTHSIERRIEEKYLAAFDIIERRLHASKYDFTKVYFLFVTTNPTHMKHMMERLHEMTADKPSLRKHFLFKRHPSLNSDDRPRATGHMATEPWERVGYPALSLI